MTSAGTELEKNAQDDSNRCYGDSLTLASGRRACGWLRDAELLGEILASSSDTFLLVSGWGCTDCDAMQQIVLRRLGDGPLEWGGSRAGDFDMPGVETDYEDSSRIVAHTRLFWGRCLSSEPAAVIQLDSLKPVGADSVWVVVAEPDSDSIRTREGGRPVTIARELVAAVSRGDCHEIVPRDRMSSP